MEVHFIYLDIFNNNTKIQGDSYFDLNLESFNRNVPKIYPLVRLYFSIDGTITILLGNYSDFITYVYYNYDNVNDTSDYTIELSNEITDESQSYYIFKNNSLEFITNNEMYKSWRIIFKNHVNNIYLTNRNYNNMLDVSVSNINFSLVATNGSIFTDNIININTNSCIFYNKFNLNLGINNNFYNLPNLQLVFQTNYINWKFFNKLLNKSTSYITNESVEKNHSTNDCKKCP
jgi:hypothetical protein